MDEVTIKNLKKLEKNTELMTFQLKSLGTTGSNGGGGIDTSKLATADKQDDIIAKLGSIEYAYMGSITSGDFTYFGYKQNGGTHWKVMRQDTTDDSAWKYAYDTTETPTKDWTAAWSDPTVLSYNNPPN